jgi:WS/DGAT/MGAT family acyltransferase
MQRSRLTALDGSFLRVETPVAHMHVAWKGIFTPPAGGGRVTLEDLRRSVAARLSLAPRFRQRLAFPPGGLAEPVWVDDERFDIAYHVTALDPAPSVTRARFNALADEVLSTPLDRSRALWRIGLAPRLDDGTIGLVMQVHHAMVDGKSAVELALLLLDSSPEATLPDSGERWRPAPAPGAGRLALDALLDVGVESLRTARGVVEAAARPQGSVRLAATLRRAALAVGEDLMRPAPASYVNVPIGPRRTLVGHRTAIEPLLEVKRRSGVTLNDVALACVAGALRQMALAQRRMPRSLKAMVPVSTRAPDEAAALGNRISFVFLHLPVHLRSTEARLRAIHEQTAQFKRQQRAAGGETIMAAMGYLPGPLKDRTARLASSSRLYNLTVSNVPGPRVPVYLLGAELREAYPVIPLPEDHALAIGVFTYCDWLCFGAYADPEALPSVAALPDALTAAVLELTVARPDRDEGDDGALLDRRRTG